jgi:sulfur relay (sulfurtransferase) complex TusBCD TusD component (DsrE family)
MTTKTLGILIMGQMEPEELRIIEGLAHAASQMDIEVEIFLMAQGIDHIRSHSLHNLASSRAKVSFCAQNAAGRGFDRTPGYPWNLDESSQYELASMAERAERILSFT